jgi:hypothetical protein
MHVFDRLGISISEVFVPGAEAAEVEEEVIGFMAIFPLSVGTRMRLLGVGDRLSGLFE